MCSSSGGRARKVLPTPASLTQMHSGMEFANVLSAQAGHAFTIAAGPQGRPLLQAWLRPSRGVKVIYGPPVDLSAYRDRRVTRQVIQEVTALLMERIKELRPAASKTWPEEIRGPSKDGPFFAA